MGPLIKNYLNQDTNVHLAYYIEQENRKNWANKLPGWSKKKRSDEAASPLQNSPPPARALRKRGVDEA